MRRIELVTVLFLAVFAGILIAGAETGGGAAGSFEYTVTKSGSGISVTDGSGMSMTKASERDPGSWGWDENGNGPFNSFYALFDARTGECMGKLDPNNLGKFVNSQEDAPSASNNVMWCIPKMSIQKISDNQVRITNSGPLEENSPFVIDGKEYNYLAIGVYLVNQNMVAAPGTVAERQQSGWASSINTDTKGSSIAAISLSQYSMCELLLKMIGSENTNGTTNRTQSPLSAGPYGNRDTGKFILQDFNMNYPVGLSNIRGSQTISHGEAQGSGTGWNAASLIRSDAVYTYYSNARYTILLTEQMVVG